MKRVLFAGGGTGGHLYPAMALASALKAQDAAVEVHFVGATRGVEARVLPAEGLPHTLLTLEPLRRSRPWQNWRLIPSLTRSALGLKRLFSWFEPKLVVGTGGYASGPAGFFAVITGVPLALQEQNSFPGLTTRWLSRWARQVHLGFPEAEKYLKPGRNTRVLSLGNPIRPPDATIAKSDARAQFGLADDGIVILVVGGSQGARAVNEALLGALQKVHSGELERVAGVQILWATGPAHFDRISAQLQGLGLEWVHAHGYIQNMPHALAAADIALSRAGAMATAEQLAWGIPSVLVPLPTAAADHQTHNARALADAGVGVFLGESELTPERLWNELVQLARDDARRAEMSQRARERARPHASHEIARELMTLMEGA